MLNHSTDDRGANQRAGGERQARYQQAGDRCLPVAPLDPFKGGVEISISSQYQLFGFSLPSLGSTEVASECVASRSSCLPFDVCSIHSSSVMGASLI